MVIQEMGQDDCFHVLARTRLGRLACAHENQPYIVPIYFVYHEPFLYGFTTPGQKVDWLRSNPLVCVEFDEVGDSDEWTSVVIFGRYEELPETSECVQERARAHDLLQRHARWWEPGCACRTQHDRQRPLTPVFYRIRIVQITGRRAKPDPVESRRSRQHHRIGERRGRLRLFLRALTARLAGWRRAQWSD
jgi:nitroimidazol reductase NimA-like FMN-containing flavoprotein (pyridoxamine 5'-phosphate oxidase superfamily)